MKYLFFFLLLCFNIQAMRASKKSAQPKTAPSALCNLSNELKIAIRDIDFAKTQTVLNKIAALNKKSEELLCLELEVTTYTEAIKFQKLEYSKHIANLAAHEEIAKHKNGSKTIDTKILQTVCQSATLDHAKAIAIDRLVLNFFIERMREQPNCSFNFSRTTTPLLP